MSDGFDLTGAAEAGERIAWLDEHGALSFAELAARVAGAAAELRAAGLDPTRGDRVLVVPALDRASVLAILAALELRAPVVLAHPAWSAAELEHAVAAADPRLVWRGGDIVARPVQPHRDARPAVVVFTSGTTGRPKGVCLSRRALLAASEAHGHALPWREHDRWLLAMPVAHVGGLSIVLRCLSARRTVVLGPPRFDPGAMLDTVRRFDVTLVSVVPTMLQRVLPLPPPPTVRAVLVGGAACSPELLARGRAAGWPLLPTYGLSECCAQVCTQRLDDPRPSGVGPPLPGVQLRVQDGAIEVSGPTCMDGFLGEAPLAPGAWYRTGDVGSLDASGHLHVAGRLDDRIVTGGENVDPLAVEEALVTHPAVRAACVVGLPDPEWGQRVAALVVLGDPSVSPDALRAHLEPRIARFALPRAWTFIDALPLTPAGKVDRRAAKERMGP